MNDLTQAKGDRLTADRAMLQLMKRERALASVADNGRATGPSEDTRPPRAGYVWALRT